MTLKITSAALGFMLLANTALQGSNLEGVELDDLRSAMISAFATMTVGALSESTSDDAIGKAVLEKLGITIEEYNMFESGEGLNPERREEIQKIIDDMEAMASECASDQHATTTGEVKALCSALGADPESLPVKMLILTLESETEGHSESETRHLLMTTVFDHLGLPAEERAAFKNEAMSADRRNEIKLQVRDAFQGFQELQQKLQGLDLADSEEQ